MSSHLITMMQIVYISSCFQLVTMLEVRISGWAIKCLTHNLELTASVQAHFFNHNLCILTKKQHK